MPVTKRWITSGIGVLTSALLSACGSLGGGEAVSYAVWNDSNSKYVYSPQLKSAKSPQEILDGVDPGTWHPPKPKGATGWRGLGGSAIPSDVGHKVPETAVLTWRLPPKPGQNEYAGDLVGPFEIRLRSKIPAHVLERVKGSRDSVLAIGVSVGDFPIKMRWVLQEVTFSNGQPVGGWRDIERGGDW